MKLSNMDRAYSRVAPFYDRFFEVILDKILFFDEKTYRAQAVESLCVGKGNKVLDIGCGTGRNFPLIQRKIGLSGELVGLDYTRGMLATTRSKVLKNSWKNVRLVKGDAQEVSEILKDQRFDGIITTFCLSIVPGWDKVIRQAAMLLKENGRFVVLDFRKFRGALSFLNPLFILIAMPFAGWEDYVVDKPWESILKENLRNVTLKEYYRGIGFLAVGEN